MITPDANDIYKEIILTPEFKRLKNVSFLGILGYSLLEPKTISSRYDHSIAVADMCFNYCISKDMTYDDKTYITLAGLLHDIGHSCFSHSLEPIFKRKFGIDHHHVTKQLVLFSSGLNIIWNKYNIDPIHIVDIIEGDNTSIVTKIPFNFDTLDGIYRTENHFKSNLDTKDIVEIIYSHLCEDDLSEFFNVYDLFWEQKNRVYNSYIYNSKHQQIESTFQSLLENELKTEHYLFDDLELICEIPIIEGFISDIRSGLIGKWPVEENIRKLREFKVDKTKEFKVDSTFRYKIESAHEKVHSNS